MQGSAAPACCRRPLLPLLNSSLRNTPAHICFAHLLVSSSPNAVPSATNEQRTITPGRPHHALCGVPGGAACLPCSPSRRADDMHCPPLHLPCTTLPVVVLLPACCVLYPTCASHLFTLASHHSCRCGVARALPPCCRLPSCSLLVILAFSSRPSYSRTQNLRSGEFDRGVQKRGREWRCEARSLQQRARHVQALAIARATPRRDHLVSKDRWRLGRRSSRPPDRPVCSVGQEEPGGSPGVSLAPYKTTMGAP